MKSKTSDIVPRINLGTWLLINTLTCLALLANAVSCVYAPRDELSHRDHGPRHGGVYTQVGELHIELVRQSDTFRLYVYDADGKPISAVELEGTLEFEEFGDAVKSVPLIGAGGGEYVAAQVAPNFDPTEAMVKARYRGETLMMCFPLRVTLSGALVDVDCFLKDGSAALDRNHDVCAKTCMESGRSVGFLTEDDPHCPVYLVTLRSDCPSAKATNEELLSLAKKQVRVNGKIVQRERVGIIEMISVQPIPVDQFIK